jgi:hypothetical protein
MIIENAAREEDGRNLSSGVMAGRFESDKRELGRPPMRKAGSRNVLEKKGLHPKMEP